MTNIVTLTCDNSHNVEYKRISVSQVRDKIREDKMTTIIKYEDIVPTLDALEAEYAIIVLDRDACAKQRDDLRKQLIELQTDKAELIAQRDTWIGTADDLRKQLEGAIRSNKNVTREWEVVKAERDELRKQLEVAVEALKRIAKSDAMGGRVKDWKEANEALKRLEQK